MYSMYTSLDVRQSCTFCSLTVFLFYCPPYIEYVALPDSQLIHEYPSSEIGGPRLILYIYYIIVILNTRLILHNNITDAL